MVLYRGQDWKPKGVKLPRLLTELRKAPSQAWAVGARIYWENAARLATTVVASNTLIGAATEPVAGGVNDTIGRVRLNGVA